MMPCSSSSSANNRKLEDVVKDRSQSKFQSLTLEEFTTIMLKPRMRGSSLSSANNRKLEDAVRGYSNYHSLQNGQLVYISLQNYRDSVIECTGFNGNDCRIVYRACYSIVTEKDISKGKENLVAPNKDEALAVDARQRIDLKVGVAFTRFQTSYFQGKYGNLDSHFISYGPCQTPTRRYLQITTFKPEKFWSLHPWIIETGFEVNLDWERNRLFDSDVDSSALGFGPQLAMQLAERLYTQSYPRTESTAYPSSFDFWGAVEGLLKYPIWGNHVQYGVITSKHSYHSLQNGQQVDISRPSRLMAPHPVGSEESKTTNLASLPDEVLIKTFLQIPAEVLHDAIRPLCRCFRRILRNPSFIEEHLSKSPITTIIRVERGPFTISFVDINQTTWKSDKKMNFKIPKMYVGCGDGLILTRHLDDESQYFLSNPLTKQTVMLPSLPVNSRISHLWAVACSRPNFKCKVLYTHNNSNAGTCTTYILTVGVDKEWRTIRGEPSTRFNPDFKGNHAQGIWGFIYWFSAYTSRLLALDLETEVFHEVLLPEELRGKYLYFTSSERYLSSASVNGRRGIMKFWQLVDCKSGGEWRKLGTAYWSTHKELREIGMEMDQKISTRPVAVSSNGDVVLFRLSSICTFDKYYNSVYVAYNVKTHILTPRYQAPSKGDKITAFPHINSLVVF